MILFDNKMWIIYIRMSESNISVNFRKDNEKIYLESLTDGDKEIEVNKGIPILNINSDGKYVKGDNFQENMNNILNKDNDVIEEEEEQEYDVIEDENKNVGSSQYVVKAEKEEEGFIPNNEELVKKIEEIVTEYSINKNLNAENLLTIKNKIPQLITDVENNIKNIGNTETTETALSLYSPDVITEYKNGIVDNIEQNFEKILVNKPLLDVFDKNTRTNIAEKIYDEISKKFVHNELVKYNGDTTSDTTQNIEIKNNCSNIETEKFIKDMDCNKENIKTLIKKYHPDQYNNSECKNEANTAAQALIEKRKTCKNKQQLDNLNDKREELFLDINKYKYNTEQVIKNLVALGEKHNKNALDAFNNKDIDSMEQHIEYMKVLPSKLKDVESKIKGGKKNRTKKATKAGKKKTKRVRFVMTKKGRKNKKNRTRR